MWQSAALVLFRDHVVQRFQILEFDFGKLGPLIFGLQPRLELPFSGVPCRGDQPRLPVFSFLAPFVLFHAGSPIKPHPSGFENLDFFKWTVAKDLPLIRFNGSESHEVSPSLEPNLTSGFEPGDRHGAAKIDAANVFVSRDSEQTFGIGAGE